MHVSCDVNVGRFALVALVRINHADEADARVRVCHVGRHFLSGLSRRSESFFVAFRRLWLDIEFSKGFARVVDLRLAVAFWPYADVNSSEVFHVFGPVVAMV